MILPFSEKFSYNYEGKTNLIGTIKKQLYGLGLAAREKEQQKAELACKQEQWEAPGMQGVGQLWAQKTARVGEPPVHSRTWLWLKTQWKKTEMYVMKQNSKMRK